MAQPLHSLAELKVLKGYFRKEKNPAKNKKSGTWSTGQAKSTSTISWSHPNVGNVVMSTQGFWLGKTSDLDGYYWAGIKVGEQRPEFLVVTFAHNLLEGIVPFYCHAGQVIDCGDGPVPELRVPITWQRQERGGFWVPSTRVKDQDNADLVFRDAKGHFINLQVAVVSRAGAFYLSVQEVGSGQIIQLPKDCDQKDYKEVVVAGQRYAVAPLLYEHAYPGADWLRSVMPRSGPRLIEIAVDDSAYTKAEDVELPEWDEDRFQFPMETRWTGAIVLWFNPLIGARVLCPDDVEAFVPLGVIPVKGTENDSSPVLAMRVGEYGLVLPRQQVLVQTKEEDKGRRVTAIKPIWPK